MKWIGKWFVAQLAHVFSRSTDSNCEWTKSKAAIYLGSPTGGELHLEIMRVVRLYRRRLKQRIAEERLHFFSMVVEDWNWNRIQFEHRRCNFLLLLETVGKDLNVDRRFSRNRSVPLVVETLPAPTWCEEAATVRCSQMKWNPWWWVWLTQKEELNLLISDRSLNYLRIKSKTQTRTRNCPETSFNL